MMAVILAAGLSTRFGGQKLLMEFSGKPIVKHVTDLVGTMEFEPKVFVYSDGAVLKTAFEDEHKASHFTHVYNPRPEEGLSSSIRLALERDVPEGIIFFAADQPMLDEATINKLVDAFYRNKGSIIVPSYSGNRGNPVIFHRKWTSRLKELTGDVGGRIIIRENPGEVWEVPVDNPLAGMDIDTREELKAIQEERIP